ncbi:tape measure protein [Stutzerimonas nitrititolerans]|uniref:tape measure protein n=1 Tax=Stutzerimonas nitrititolerans TaxID=2482751 RepID=UPI00289B363F|nr:tape measure protein [Stutzerimonas nitrititolerans]
MTEYARLVLSVDSTSGLKAASDLDRLEAASRKAEGGFDQLERQTRRNVTAATQLKTAVTALGTTLAAAVSATALRSAAGLVQTYQEMAERVQMATSSQAEFELVQRRLLATANGTYRSLSEAQELYIRTADSLRSMGYSTQQALDVTDSMSYAFVKNATSAERAETAISAFSKSMNTGRVAADQWETITTALPSVINDIAAATGRSATEIRAMGAAGKLTARDLSEGLRKSLDENSKAAANMANNLTDAGVRAKTATTAILVAFENQSGAIQSVTNSIISAADSVLAFSEDTEAMKGALDGISTAAEYLAVAVGARLVTAMLAYTVTQGQAVTATVIRIAKEREALAVAATRAAAERQSAMASLAVAKAEFEAAKGTNAHAIAARNLSAAQAVALQAAANQAAAQSALNSAMRVGTIVAGGLRSAMALLGGPAGVVLLAAGALYTFASNARDAKQPVDLLTESVNDLGDATLRALRADLLTKIETESSGAAGELTALNARVETLKGNLERYPGSAKAQEWREELERTAEKALVADEALEKYRKRLRAVDEEIAKRSKAPELSDPEEPTTSAEGQKAIARMREQLDLAKLQGEARARLAAIQSLGAEATKEEREEAEQLATQLYRLEEAERARGKTSEKNLKQQVSALELQAKMLGMNAAEATLYKLAMEGATEPQLSSARTALQAVDAYEKQAEAIRKVNEAEEGTNREAVSIIDALMTEEEAIKQSYERRRQIIMDATLLTAEERNEAMIRLEQERDEQLLELNGSFWEQYLAAAEKNLTNFDELAGNMLENFSSRFGDAFESMVFDAQTLGDAVAGLAEGMARSIVNALGEMAAQWLAYQAVQMVVGKTTQASAATAMTFNAMAAQQLAAINAYASAAAIPYTGYAMAPAAAAAAIAATSPMVGAVSTLAMAGMAHDGIDNIPKEGTWLLDKGERVVDRRTNADLKDYLSSKGGGGSTPQITINAPVTVQAQPGMSQQDAQRQGGQMARAFRDGVVDVLRREMGQGGVLYRRE